jgi:integrase
MEEGKKYYYEPTRYPGIYRYVGAKGEAYVIDFYENGKRHRETISGGLTKAKEEVEKRREAGRQGTFIPQNKLTRYTMEDLIVKYKQVKGEKPSFLKTESYAVDMIGEYFKGRKLISIRAEDFDLFFRDRMKALKKDGKPRTNCSANREVALLRHLLNKAVYWDMLQVNPYAKFAKERSGGGSKPVFLAEPRRDVVLEPKQLEQIVPHCKPYLRNIILGLIYTGLRVRDLLNLKWDDIDWEKRTFEYIELKKSREGEPKTGTKPMSRDFVNLITSIPKTEKGGGYIFVGDGGEHLQGPPKGFRRMLKKAGIADLRMRDLRRTSASTLLSQGASLPAIQRHLGHTKIAMTEKYLHVGEKQQKEEIEKLDGLFVPNPNLYSEKLVRNPQKQNPLISEGAANA